MAAREWLVATVESAWGVPTVTPTAAQAPGIHLPAPNSFTVRARPRFWSEKSAGSANRPLLTGSAQAEVKGTLKTRLFASQAKLLMGLACNLSGSPYDLGSIAFDYAIVPDDNSTAIKRQFLGNKIKDFTLTGNNQPGGTELDATFNLLGWKPATSTIAEPTWATTPGYPTGNPWLFQQSKANLTIGAARANYRSFSLKVVNELSAPFDENQYVSQVKWRGRQVSLDVEFRYLAATDRAAFEAVTPQAVSLGFSDGTNLGTFNMFGACVISSLEDDLAWAGDGFYQKLTLDGYVDVTQSPANDLLYTQTP